MALENDAGKDVKKIGLLVAAGLVVLFGIYLVISWLNRPAPAPTRISIDAAATGSGKKSQESTEYREILDKYNDTGATKATQSGDSFIASVHTSDVSVSPPAPSPTPAAPPQPKTQQVRQRIPVPQLDPEKKKAIDNLLKELNEQWQPATGQVSVAMGTENGGQSNQGNAYAAWTSSITPQATSATYSTSTVGSSALPDMEIIAAGTRVSAVIDNLVDSDNTRSNVTAHVPAGQYAGALFLSHDVQLQGDGVSIHFTEMSWNGVCYRVDVWAERQDTLAGNVASHVNNRYWSRVILPALAHGVGQVGQLYEDANTQILTTQYGEVTANVDSPDSQAVTGTIVGGMADKAGQVLENDAQKLPVKQVTVDRNEPVSLLFMKPVKQSDDESRQSTRTAQATPSVTPQYSQSPAIAQPQQAVAATPPQSTTQRGYPRRSDSNY
ncbi:conjugal transfer protein TraO [Citrobacter braakii]|uniref:conjugal transfer protein TraO n=1 Tax=Citrobacter braakii TaxID=57706 RepID=UPI004039B408